MKKSFFFLLLLFNCLHVFAQTVDRSKFITDSLDNYVNNALTAWHIPGAAVGIIKDGQVVLMKGYGVKQTGLSSRVDQNTLFMLGNNTCPFTATALATLQAEGKLTLNDKVIKYLPDFKLATPLLSQEVAIRDLLAQRVGFGVTQGMFSYWNSNLTQNEIAKKLQSIVPYSGFRTIWGYTDATYLLASEVIPKVTGKSWEQYVKERLLIPLGMNNTITSSSDLAKASNKAAAHILDDGVLSVIDYPVLDNIAPAIGMMMNVQDLGKWVAALLANGKVGNEQIIPVRAIRSTMSPVTYLSTYKRTTGEMCINLEGLGWMYQTYGSKVLMLRDDVGSGFTSIINLIPEDKLGIIVLTNSQTNFFHEALALEILDVYMERPYQDYSSKFAVDMRSQDQNESEYLTAQQENARLRDTVALRLKPALSPDNYTGRYENPLYGSMMIERDTNNDLKIHFEHHPQMTVQLQPLGGNRFYAVYSDPLFGRAVFPFEMEDGKVTGVTISSDIEYYPYHFKKLQ